MAIIIETCPNCGHDLQNIMLTSYPPIPKKVCWNCGWSWIGKQEEEVVRQPFGGAGMRSSFNCIDDKITDEEVQECLATTIKTMVAD